MRLSLNELSILRTIQKITIIEENWATVAILSGLSFKEGHARFTTVPLKP